MSPSVFIPAEQEAGAFAAFDLPPQGRSIYAFSPVFKVRWHGQDAILKRTFSKQSPARLADWLSALARAGVAVVQPLSDARRDPQGQNWVLYPFVTGRIGDATSADLQAAGRLLGQTHAVNTQFLPPFRWPDNDAESVAEDVAGLAALSGQVPAPVLARLIRWEEDFNTEVCAPLRAADLPWHDVCMDFKANNLVYTAVGRPTLIDPDNGEYAPRLLDLALAALLFYLDDPRFPRMLTTGEWQAFYDGYASQVRLTATERELWPLMLRYALQEWGVWHLTQPENWNDPQQARFLTALAVVLPDQQFTK